MGLITHPHTSHNQSNWGITPGFDSVVTKTIETKSSDHWKITHGIVLKPHKAHGLHYFETHSLCLGSFRKTLNNLTSTKFVRFQLHSCQ